MLANNKLTSVIKRMFLYQLLPVKKHLSMTSLSEYKAYLDKVDNGMISVLGLMKQIFLICFTTQFCGISLNR